jgi:hypothetical protein
LDRRSDPKWIQRKREDRRSDPKSGSEDEGMWQKAHRCIIDDKGKGDPRRDSTVDPLVDVEEAPHPFSVKRKQREDLNLKGKTRK